MKQETRGKSTELNQIKNSKKYRTQLNENSEVQNWINWKSRRSTELNYRKNSKKYSTQLDEKFEEEELQNSIKSKTMQ